MKSLSLLSVLITYFLIIYVVSATELDSNHSAVPISEAGSSQNGEKESDEVASKDTSTTEETEEVSSLDLKEPAVSELDSQQVDQNEQEHIPVSTSIDVLDINTEPEAVLSTTEARIQDEIEEAIKKSEEIMSLEETMDVKEEASTAVDLSDDEASTTADLSGDEASTIADLSGDEVSTTTDLSADEASTATGLSGDEVSTTTELSGDEVGQTSEEQVSDFVEKIDEKDQEETQESLVVHKYDVPLKFVCETKKLICHNTSTSSAITIQGSRKGSALFASFDSSIIRNSGLTSGDIVSATLVLNKIGGTRTLPVRVDVLNLESKSSRISKSTVLATYQAVLPKTQNSPVSVDITSAIRELLENAKDHEKFSILVSAYSKTRFGDILTYPTKDYPNGLTLELSVTRLPEDQSDLLEAAEPVKEVQSLKDRVFSGQNLYIAMGILATVSIVVIVLMMM